MDDRHEYYKYKEARQYHGGRGIYRMTFGALMFFASFYSYDELGLYQFLLFNVLGILSLTSGVRTYYSGKDQ